MIWIIGNERLYHNKYIWGITKLFVLWIDDIVHCLLLSFLAHSLWNTIEKLIYPPNSSVYTLKYTKCTQISWYFPHSTCTTLIKPAINGNRDLKRIQMNQETGENSVTDFKSSEPLSYKHKTWETVTSIKLRKCLRNRTLWASLTLWLDCSSCQRDPLIISISWLGQSPLKCMDEELVPLSPFVVLSLVDQQSNQH